MTQDNVALMLAVFGAALLLAALLGRLAGNAKADVALMGGSGLAFGGVSLLLLGT